MKLLIAFTLLILSLSAFTKVVPHDERSLDQDLSFKLDDSDSTRELASDEEDSEAEQERDIASGDEDSNSTPKIQYWEY